MLKYNVLIMLLCIPALSQAECPFQGTPVQSDNVEEINEQIKIEEVGSRILEDILQRKEQEVTEGNDSDNPG